MLLGFVKCSKLSSVSIHENKNKLLTSTVRCQLRKYTDNTTGGDIVAIQDFSLEILKENLPDLHRAKTRT